MPKKKAASSILNQVRKAAQRAIKEGKKAKKKVVKKKVKKKKVVTKKKATKKKVVTKKVMKKKKVATKKKVGKKRQVEQPPPLPGRTKKKRQLIPWPPGTRRGKGVPPVIQDKPPPLPGRTKKPGQLYPLPPGTRRGRGVPPVIQDKPPPLPGRSTPGRSMLPKSEAAVRAMRPKAAPQMEGRKVAPAQKKVTKKKTSRKAILGTALGAGAAGAVGGYLYGKGQKKKKPGAGKGTGEQGTPRPPGGGGRDQQPRPRPTPPNEGGTGGGGSTAPKLPGRKGLSPTKHFPVFGDSSRDTLAIRRGDPKMPGLIPMNPRDYRYGWRTIRPVKYSLFYAHAWNLMRSGRRRRGAYLIRNIDRQIRYLYGAEMSDRFRIGWSKYFQRRRTYRSPQ